jgi:L-threonylcarbamoyladenylate synthase
VALIHYSNASKLAGAQAPHAALRLAASPGAYAQALYAALRQMDGRGADLILVETPPQEALWLGVNDRLRRAAHGSGGVVDNLLDGVGS